MRYGDRPPSRDERTPTMDVRHVDSESLLTARLSLQRPTITDIDPISRIPRDRRACAHTPPDMLATRSDAEAFYRRWDEHWSRHGFGYWVIRRRDGHQRDATAG